MASHSHVIMERDPTHMTSIRTFIKWAFLSSPNCHDMQKKQRRKTGKAIDKKEKEVLGISLFIFYPFCFNTRSRCLDVLWLWKVGPTWKDLLSTLKCNGLMVHLLTRTPTERANPYRTKKLTGKKENICRSVRKNGTSAFKCHCVVVPNGNTKSK